MSKWKRRLMYSNREYAKSGHIIKRARVLGVDQVLMPKDGDFEVFSHEFETVQETGEYWCSCGNYGMTKSEALEHLQEVRE